MVEDHDNVEYMEQSKHTQRNVAGQIYPKRGEEKG
jgi:hypothetical protein